MENPFLIRTDVRYDQGDTRIWSRYSRERCEKLLRTLPERRKDIARLQLTVSAKVDAFLTSRDVGDGIREHFADLLEETKRARKDFETVSLVSLRNYPEGDLQDTIVVDDNRKMKYEHDATGRLFIQNGEILDVQLRLAEDLSESYRDRDGEAFFERTEDSRCVMQQVGMRSCVAVCGFMVALDLGGEPPVATLKRSNLGNSSSLQALLGHAGLQATTEHRATDRRVIEVDEWKERMEQVIGEYAPVVLSINGEIQGHAIVVDSFSLENDEAVIRDPYRGWSVRITAQALLDRGPQSMTYVERDEEGLPVRRARAEASREGGIRKMISRIFRFGK